MALSGIFKNRIGIENEIDNFLNFGSEAGLTFIQGVNAWLADDHELFEQHLNQIVATEREADGLRRSIEDLLYRKTLIPESRGDVLELIEDMDDVLGQFKSVLYRIDIERPVIAAVYHEGFKALNDCAVQTVESIVISLRAYFKNIAQVADHMHKVAFWETETDKAATRLQKSIFASEDHSLAEKLQLRGIIKNIDCIADLAEDLADKLAIFAIKRSL